jgi:predicted permease
MRPLLSLVPVELPALSRVSVDGTVLAFTMVVSVLTGVLAGILPALHFAKGDINTSLKEGSRRAAGTKSGRVTRLTLVAGEMALTLIVLVGAALLIQTFAQLRSLDPGFDPQNILTLKMPLSETKYEHSADLEAIHRVLLPSIEALPGVDAAGAATTLPMEIGIDFNFVIEGRTIEGMDEGVGNGQYRAVTPRFFQAMGIPLLRGRLFEAGDGTDAPDVVIINAAAAERYWPDEEPIGQEIRIGPPQFEDIKERKTVVGVVGDVKELGLEEEPPVLLYVPLSQMAERFSKLSVQLLPLRLVVKSDVESAGLVPAVEKAVWSYDPDQPVTGAIPMEQVVAKSIGPQKFSMTMMSVFAAVALLLALVGIYGVLSNIVAQCTHEIGVRIALGASKPRILTLVMKEMVWVVVVGIGIGLAGAFALGRLLSSLLFGVSPTDPVTLIGVTLSLVAAAFAAAHIPARKAASVEPIQTLRYE